MMNYQAPLRLTALGALVLSLSACGGGGGGGGTVPTTTTNYTPTTTTTGTSTTTTTSTPTTSAVAPIVYCCDSTTAPTTVTELLQLNGGVSNGLAITTHLTGTSSGLTGVTGGGTSASPASVTVNMTGAVDRLTISTIDAAAWANTMTYNSPDSFIFDVWNSDVLTYWYDWTVTDPSDIKVATAYLDTGPADQADASAQKYQYMAWGTWLTTEYLSTDTTIDTVEGFLVVGKPTDPGNIPTSGTATYSGETTGQALDGAIYASFNATADFQRREIAVNSSNTVLDQGTAGTTAAPQYDFSGTATYSADVNQFSGAISNPTSGMTGTATGMFFGPAAEEIGGVFEMTNGTLGAKGLFVAN